MSLKAEQNKHELKAMHIYVMLMSFYQAAIYNQYRLVTGENCYNNVADMSSYFYAVFQKNLTIFFPTTICNFYSEFGHEGTMANYQNQQTIFKICGTKCCYLICYISSLPITIVSGETNHI